MADFEEHSAVRYVLHEATALARCFGRDRAYPLDLLHACADRLTPVGRALSDDGLSEETMIHWRRENAPHEAPILDLTPAWPSDAAVRVLREVMDIGWMLSADTTQARVAHVVLDRAADPEVVALLAATGTVRRRTLRMLRKVGAPEITPRPNKPGDWVREYRVVGAWRLVDGTVVLVPDTDRVTDTGYRTSIVSAATVVPPHTGLDEVGDLVRESFTRCGPDRHAGYGPPYWELFGHATRRQFNRRARYASAIEFGATVGFDASVHSGADRFEHVHWLTPVRAPLDRPGQIGAALTAALDASRG